MIRYDTTQVASATTDATGGFYARFKAPASDGGEHNIVASDGISTIVSTFAMDSAPPPIPTLLSPTYDTKVDAQASFNWTDVSDPSGVTYVFQIASDSSFGILILEKTGLTSPGYQMMEEEKLESGSMVYYWRVKAIDAAHNESDWTFARTFRVGSAPPAWISYIVIGCVVIAATVTFFWIRTRRQRW
jgi:hypothetical protein